MSRRPPVIELALAALAASSATAVAIFSYQALSRRRRRLELNDEVKESLADEMEVESSLKSHPVRRPSEAERFPPKSSLKSGDDARLFGLDESAEYDETLIREQLTRNYAFFGEEGMKKIRGGRVAIIGCGGVGSWAAVMLVRS